MENKIEKDFVPHRQALDLKELGFDEECCACYGSYTHKTSELFLNINNPVNIETLLREPTAFNQPSFYVKSPTFSQAFRWFREKHNLMGIVGYHKNWLYSYLIENIENHKTIIVEDTIKIYEEAELECLKKLIEICKKHLN